MDTKSQISKNTSASKVITSSNAYLYGKGDLDKMQELNSQLEKYNPSLVGS